MNDNTNYNLYNDLDIGNIGFTGNTNNTDNELFSKPSSMENNTVINSDNSFSDNSSFINSGSNSENMEDSKEEVFQDAEDTISSNIPPMEKNYSDYSSLLADIDALLFQHNYDFNRVISISGNTIMVTPDDTTSALLRTMEFNQRSLMKQNIIMENISILIFFVIMAELMWHCAKRIVKNMMIGGKNNG